ncbi:MAG: hypothetical protein WKH64_05575 [Chloroflexia bacterium]
MGGIETVYLKDFLQGGDWYRMNTVFKFGLQELGAASTWLRRSALCDCATITREAASRCRVFARFGAPCRLAHLPSFRHSEPAASALPRAPPGRTLDGEAFLRTATLSDESGAVELFRYDYEAVLWLRESVPTPETIVEASIGPYRSGGRISMFTGLPTLVGWDSHESNSAIRAGQREEHAESAYFTTRPTRSTRYV